MDIDDTQPYRREHGGTVADPATPPADAPDTDPLRLRIHGELELGAGCSRKLILVLDSCPDLCHVAELVGNRMRFRAERLQVTHETWTRLHRGLCMCAALSVAGTVTIDDPCGWHTEVAATGGRPPRSRRAGTRRSLRDTRGGD